MAWEIPNFKSFSGQDWASFGQNMAWKSLKDMPYDTDPFIHPNGLDEFYSDVNYTSILAKCAAYYKDKPHLRIE